MSVHFKPLNTFKRYRVLLVGLLILCLSPAAMKTPWLNAGGGSGVDPYPDVIISAFSGGTAADIAIRSRIRSVAGFDDLLKVTLMPERPLIHSGRISLSPFSEGSARVVNLIDYANIPVRAPPVNR